MLDEAEMMKRAQEQFNPGVNADQDLIVVDMMADLEGEVCGPALTTFVEPVV